MRVEVVERGDYFSPGGNLDLELVFAGAIRARFILSAVEGGEAVNVLAIPLIEDPELEEALDAVGLALVEAEKVAGAKADLALVRGSSLIYRFTSDDLEVIRKVYSHFVRKGEPPKASKVVEILASRGGFEEGPVCVHCPFNPMNLAVNVFKPASYLIDLLGLMELDPTEEPEYPFDICFNCAMTTKHTLLQGGFKPLGRVPKPAVERLRVRGVGTKVVPVEGKILEVFNAGYTTVKLVETGEGLILSLEPLGEEAESLMHALRVRLRDALASRGLTLDLRDRTSNYSLLTRVINEVAGELGVDPGILAKVREHLIAQVTGLGVIQPLVEVSRAIGLADIKMAADSRVMVSTLTFGNLPTNVRVSGRDVVKISKSLAYRRPNVRERGGVLEAAAPVELINGDRIVIRVQLRRPPASIREEATLRFLSPTGLFHFAFPPPYGYGNASPELIAMLTLLFGRVSMLTVGEPGSAKSSLHHALLASLPPRSSLIYVAESPELDVESLSALDDLQINTFTLDAGLEEAMKQNLREWAQFALVEEARTREELEYYLRDVAAVRGKIAVTYHATKAELVAVRSSLGDLLNLIDVIVLMSPISSKPGERPRYVVREVVTPDGRRLGGWTGDGWEHEDPETLVSLFPSIRDSGFDSSLARRFFNSVLEYLRVLWERRDEIARLGPRWDARSTDRRAFRAIYSGLEAGAAAVDVEAVVDASISEAALLS